MHSATIKPLLSAILFNCCYFLAQAQTTISGTVTDIETGEPLIGVNVLVQGTVLGTITDYEGNFNLNVASDPPLTLTISSVGYERQELEISNKAITNLSVKMTESFMLGQEVVVSASRVEESILQSPVSIEKMDILAVQNTSSDNYYKAIANLKGVDVASSSINFQIINARGFGNTGNTRFVQLTDGMDTQAPALNFPIGNLNGPSELDIESVELIPGASSALYGPSAFNGVLLINGKNAFDYQGLSAFVKTGVNHTGSNADHAPAPLYDMSLRYAKAFKDKFAFKVNFSYSQAEDWHGTDRTDRNASLQPEGLSFNPGADYPHYHGDEAGINLAIFPFSDDFQLIARGTRFDNGRFASNYITSGNNDLPSHVVTLTPYAEEDLIDYGAENIKFNTGLYYRINDKVELSYLFNGGWGTSIYTGAQRYSLSNFGITQHRLQLRGDNFQVKAYGTFEDSGDSYITEFLAKRVNDLAVGYNYPDDFFREQFYGPNGEGSLTGYLVDYGIEYLRYLADDAGLQPGEIDGLSQAERLAIQESAHQSARGYVDGLYHLGAGTTTTDLETGETYTWEQLKKKAKKGVVPDGPSFADKSGMYHAEGQYDFKNQIDFMELQMGASFRMYDLGSKGTIFPDTAGNEISIKEYGVYAQMGKRFSEEFKLSGSVRFDKNENFKGQVNPRIAGVWTIGGTHNLRAAVQTGFRFPTTQGQYIDLDIISRRLLGGLPQFYDTYDLTKTSITGQPLVFTQSSVDAFRNEVFRTGDITDAAAGLLEPFTNAKPVKPEQVKSIELGYKSLLGNKFLIDAVYYYNIYTDFITQIQLVKAEEYTDDESLDRDTSPYGYTYDPDAGATAGDVAPGSILNGTSDNAYQIYTNIDNTVKTQGAAIGLTYSLPKGYTIGGNYNWNQFISGYDDNALKDFNTPEHKFNIKFENRKLTKNLGFATTWRWQEGFRWESSFVKGDVPAYSTLDAQVSYKMSKLKSIVKVGGSNLLGNYYIQSLGGPNIGAIYYISVTFDELMN
ncbi:MAG: TonB-dependent receptor [Cyclobacteriaceae bacterium]